MLLIIRSNWGGGFQKEYVTILENTQNESEIKNICEENMNLHLSD